MTTFDTTLRAEYPALERIVYLTGVSTPTTREARRDDLGLLATPASSVHRQRHHYGVWAADNGCFAEFTSGKTFDADRWLAWLENVGPAGCLFAALPDVVGDAAATWARSEPYIDTVKALGFPVAIVLQDGLEELPDVWAQILARADAVFVGGSTEWKLGAHAARFIAEARAAGLWVHVGRVNSYKRLRHFHELGADSADGTFVGFAPRENVGRLFGWLDKLAAVPRPEIFCSATLDTASVA